MVIKFIYFLIFLDNLFNKGLFETNKSKNYQSSDENSRNNYM